ncbi:MAG: transposase [Verrucomicrobiales bacterium]|nr:transposase [Verrucomicrobiales bacterium]
MAMIILRHGDRISLFGTSSQVILVTTRSKECGLPVHISERIQDGFAVLPRRWVVERTFAWGNGQRRLSKDYKKSTLCSEAMIRHCPESQSSRCLTNSFLAEMDWFEALSKQFYFIFE